MDSGGGSPSSGPTYDKISGEAPNDPDVPFSGLGDDFDEFSDIDAFASTSSTKAPAVATPPAPPATPPQIAVEAPAPQPPAAPPAAPDAAAQTAPAATPAEAPAAPTDVPPADLDALLTAFDAQAAEIFQQVAPQFQLTAEQITELETDAATAVPKLLANTYLKTIKTTMSMVKEIIPQMINQTIVRNEAAREMENSFFKQWNLLDRTKHGNDIRMFAQTFAAANPKMSQSELFSLVGAAVMAKHGLAMPSTAPAASAPAASAPSFTPAVASAPVTHQKPVGEQNPFAGMGFHFDDE